MLKWLAIACVVLLGFSMVLLGLGSLLVDNKTQTTLLKQQLNDELLKQQAMNEKRLARQRIDLLDALTPAEQSIKALINSHLHCQSSHDCMLFETHNAALGCTVAVNTLGAAVLIKINTGASPLIESPEQNQTKPSACLEEHKSITTACYQQSCIVINESY